MTSYFTLEDIKGQPKAIRYLEKYANSPELLPPLLLFYGPDGVGKESAAERLMRHVLCLEGNNCGHCISCKAFMQNAHPDFIRFPEDKDIPIGQPDNPEEFSIRWLQRTRLHFRPHLSSRRFILFPDASRIGDEAETALLKSLEEPPEFSRFIFLARSLDDLKDTIKSRAILIPFFFIPPEEQKKIQSFTGLNQPTAITGSMSPYPIPLSEQTRIHEFVLQHASTPLQFIELEKFLKEYKNNHPDWETPFDYIAFLDYASFILLTTLRENQLPTLTQQLRLIFEFKNSLHKRIPGIENFLISRLINGLTFTV